MIGTPTLKRLGAGVTLVTALAALAVPTGLAGGFQTDTTDSARIANGQRAKVASYRLPDGFQTDTVNSARVLGGRYALDPSIAAAMSAHEHPTVTTYRLPGGFETDTVNSARLAPKVVRIPAGGLDWSSFGIGIGVGIGGLLLLAGLSFHIRPLRRLASA